MLFTIVAVSLGPGPRPPKSILVPGYITLSLASVIFELSKLHTRVVKFNLFFFCLVGLLNLRGDDVPFNPFFFAFVIVAASDVK